MRDNTPIIKDMFKAIQVLRKEGIKGLISRFSKRLTNTINTITHTRDHKAKLRKIITSKLHRAKGVLIYPPTVDWNVPLFQRPQHLATELSRLGYLFFYCTGNNLYDNIQGFQELENNLYVTSRFDLLLRDLTEGWLMISSTNPLITYGDIRKYRRKGFKIIYDYIDEIHPEISGNVKKMQERHRLINKDNVDIVIAVSTRLYGEMIKRFPEKQVILLPNGAQYEHFRIDRNIEACPDEIRKIIEEGKPIIGYFGALAKWIDYELLNFVAENRQNWNIVLIGWNYDNTMKQLKDFRNIKYLGVKHYNELPKYGIWFDVAAIPFKEGEIAKSSSPIKLYEYMALNKPVVATRDLRECYRYKGILIANDKKEFIEKIEKGLMIKDNPEYIKLLDEQAKENTWEARAIMIDGYISKYK